MEKDSQPSSLLELPRLMLRLYHERKKETDEKPTFPCACKCNNEESLNCAKPCPFGA